MTAASFLLEHFYFGQVVKDGKPTGEPRLLAASAGVTQQIAESAVERLKLPPLIRSANGAWALVRGRSRQIPFLLVQAQQGDFGQLIEHYIIATPDVLKALGGNLKALIGVVQDVMPTFDAPGQKLPQLELPYAEPPTTETLIDDILELMMMTNNRTQIIEPMLAAIVQGTQLIIQGAPADLRERVQFVEGLMALLPSSARFGVTFTTHSLPSTEIDVQIRFYSDDLPPENSVVFNWATKRITGQEIQDDYSRLVISLLRLDAELVIQRSLAMTTIAGWRLNQGDKLADALGYAAHRFRLDEALKNNQPADKDEVSRVLSEDPTLPPELQALYAGHLIKFSLAMQDMQHADPVAMMLRNNPELEQSVRQQMQSALDEGQGWLIYDTLVNWMSNPLGPQGREWVNLTHLAALALIEALVEEQNFEEMNTLIQEMHNANPGIDIGRLVPRILQAAMPLAAEDPSLAENLFLMAIKYLNLKDFTNLMNAGKFRQLLPQKVNQVWNYLQSDKFGAAPSGLLLKLSRSYPEDWQTPILVRFAEAAVETRHFDVLDTITLEALLKVALTPPDTYDYPARVGYLMNGVEGTALSSLEHPGPRYLLQIRLALGDYQTLANEMVHQSRELYPGDLQIEYLKMVETLFAETPVSTTRSVLGLQALSERGIKSAPYLAACIGALTAQSGSPELDEIARFSCETLLDERPVLEVMPEGSVFKLFNYFVRRKDTEGMALAAELVAVATIYQGTEGMKALLDAFKNLEKEKNRPVGVEMLRYYIRHVDDKTAATAVNALGKALGENIQRTLEITYTMRQFMDGLNVEDFAARVKRVAAFLQEAVAYYTDAKSIPTTNMIVNSLETMPGNLNLEERRGLANAILAMGRGLSLIGRQYRITRQRDEVTQLEGLLAGTTDPQSIIGMWWAMSSYLGRGRRLPTDIPVPKSMHPFEGYSLPRLLDELREAVALFETACQTFTPNKPVKLTVAQVREEFHSIWNELDSDSQRELIRDFANDLQRLAVLVTRIENEGDSKLFDDMALTKKVDSGKQRPANVMEFYRFMYSFHVSRS